MNVTIKFSTDALVSEVKRIFKGVTLFAAVVLLAGACSGCGGYEPPNATETQYGLDIAGCPATAKTSAEDHACRQQVNLRYGLCAPNSTVKAECPDSGTYILPALAPLDLPVLPPLTDGGK